MAFLIYEEIVAALRLGRRLGDCVPEDIEGTARAIVAKSPKPFIVAPPHYHVVIFDENGVIIDPSSKP